MPARYRHFKTPDEIQPGADQSMEAKMGAAMARAGEEEGGWVKTICQKEKEEGRDRGGEEGGNGGGGRMDFARNEG